MFSRSYTPTYDPMATIAIEKTVTRYRYCTINKEIKHETRHWFAIENDQPYDLYDGNERQGTHLTFFEITNGMSQEKADELRDILLKRGFQWGAGFQKTPKEEMSAPNVRHFHVLYGETP